MNILSDFSNESLSRVIQHNLVGFLEYFGRFRQVTITHKPDMVTLLSEDGPFTVVNRVVRTQFDAHDDIQVRIDETVSLYRQRNLPLRWEVGPATRPGDLDKYLLDYGFRAGRPSPGMAADLHALNEDNTCPDDVRMEPVVDLEMLAVFYEMLRVGYGMPDPIIDFLAPADHESGVPDPAIFRNYVAIQKGKPVGCSMLIVNAGVAGIYGVATIPEARRQGIGAELTLLALRQARAMGYRVGVLLSTEMSHRMYESLGFKQYCTLESYLWNPDTE